MVLQKQGDVLVVKLTSKDLSDPKETARTLELYVASEGERKVLADLSDVPTLTSLQVGALVTMHLVCYENLAVMKLTGVCEKVKIVLRLVGLDQVMEVHHGPDVVRESFGPPTGNPPTTEGRPLSGTPQPRRQRTITP